MKNYNYSIKAFFIFLGLINLSAINNDMLQDNLTLLQNKVWCLENDDSRYLKFTSSDIVAYLDGEEIISVKYHLSSNNCQTSNFDTSKIGITLNGDYIFTEDKCYKIKFIDDNSFEMSLIESGNIKYTIVYKVKI